MQAWLLQHQTELRGGIFFSGLALLMVLELALPKRTQPAQRRMRWSANFALTLINSLMIALLPFAAIASAMYAAANHRGLLHLVVLPDFFSIPLAWLMLDLAIYWQHRALHEIRWLWPLHRVHHSDIELDATSGVRFHPAEIALSMLYKCGVVLALGAPPAAVLLFEIALSAFALFSHANLRLPPALDYALRAIVITPDMHRIHHSVHREETDSNYGNALSVWDRLFRSYRLQPRDGHATMRIGLPELRERSAQKLLALLHQPLQRR